MNLKNAIIDGIKSMKDGSIKITIVTRELPPNELAELFLSLNKEIVSVELPEDNNETKSPSTRLRNVLYRVWEANKKDAFQTFTLYYNHIMEQMIEAYKEKI